MPDPKKTSPLALSLSREVRRVREPAASQADVHWPLLGARSARSAEASVPSLQPEERDARQALGRRRAEAPVPTVSVPGLGQKLSRGLSRLTARVQMENDAVHSFQAESETSSGSAARSTARVEPQFSAPSLSKREQKPPAIEPDEQEADVQPSEVMAPPPKARRSIAAAPSASHAETAESESIKGMFARLVKGKDKPVPEPAHALRLPNRRK